MKNLKGGQERTLRERLAARKARLEAGIPPPDPVTMTDGFFGGEAVHRPNTSNKALMAKARRDAKLKHDRSEERKAMVEEVTG